jgi:hypothetical protein
MANQQSMPNLTELEELNGRSFSINIVLLAELADILCSVFQDENKLTCSPQLWRSPL